MQRRHPPKPEKEKDETKETKSKEKRSQVLDKETEKEAKREKKPSEEGNQPARSPLPPADAPSVEPGGARYGSIAKNPGKDKIKEEIDKKETKIKEIREKKKRKRNEKKTYLDLWSRSIVWLELTAAEARSVNTRYTPERTVLEKQRSN